MNNHFLPKLARYVYVYYKMIWVVVVLFGLNLKKEIEKVPKRAANDHG